MATAIEGLDNLQDEAGHPAPAELRGLLAEVLGRPGAAVRLTGQQRLASSVRRLHFEVGGRPCSLVVKRLRPDAAWRNQCVAERWLPAVGLGPNAPPLLGVAAERDGGRVWHAYEDLGDGILDESAPDPGRVRAAVEAIARLHARFAGHVRLAECRLWGGDLGTSFYAANVRDAARALEALRPPRAELSPERRALRDRLLRRLDRLREETASRARAELGVAETLLHGDLWPKNAVAIPAGRGPHVRLIDWDRAGVGPFSYDLSTFLSRFPPRDRPWILDAYRQAVAGEGGRLPPAGELNFLFQTAELARFAHRLIWPAVAAWEGEAGWAFDELAEVERWFEALAPVLPAS